MGSKDGATNLGDSNNASAAAIGATQGNKKVRSEPLPPRPYYQAERDPDPEWLREARELVGFDVDDTQARLERWLGEHGYLTLDTLGRSTGPSSFPPDEAVDGECEDDKRARAVLKAIMRLTHHSKMFGPERIAEARWLRELRRVLAAVERVRPYADARYSEEAYFANHALGSSGAPRLHRRTDRVGRLRGKLGALARAARDAERAVPRYLDLLPQIDAAGRPKRSFLGSVEANLYEGGFQPEAIARLAIDEQRLRDGDGPLARKAHRQRILARVRRYLAEREKRNAREAATLQDFGLTPEVLAGLTKRRRRKKVRTEV